jgi:glycosyltransferase involved in cell wall biosynthesis
LSLVFISSAEETFTPTQSGALATIMYECCRAAKKEGALPFVVVRRSPVQAFDWPNTIFVDYPNIPDAGPIWWLGRLERKIFGWQHPGQRAFANRMAKAVAANQLQQFPMVVLNNPETAILLRQKFPQATIAHWFQNQLECKPRVRAQLKDAVNMAFGVSDFTSRWVEGYYGFAAGSVPTVYNATDSSHFSASPGSRAATPIPVLNFVGRTAQEKAPDLLLKAALQLAKKGLKFTVQIVGSNHWDRFEFDDYQQQLKDLAGQLEACGIAVRFTGHISRQTLPEVLRQADINVVPSRWDEPFGMVTLEGMACGLATVVSRTGGTPEVVGDAALLFERDNVDELASHLQNLIENKSLRQEYAQKAILRTSEFSWGRMWQRLVELTTVEKPKAI